MAVILVTGGAGFIGSHIADALVGRGHDVHILDDLSSGIRDNVPAAATLHVHDVRSQEAAALFEEHRFEVLVHHAAQMDVRRSVADPRFDADVNLGGLLNLMEAGRQHGLKKVVFASTGGAIYGEPEYTPQDEAHPLNPLSPYGIAKLSSEKYLYFYEQEYGISWVALRYGNVYGPRQNPHGEAGVVAIFCERLLQDKPTVINGDGKQTRDYVFVRDVVAANMAAMEHEGSGVFNVGTGVETDVNELFRTLRDLVDPAIPENHGPAKPGEQRRSVLSYGRTADQLGWAPTVSVKEGLAATMAFFRQRLEAVGS
ncbi:MAG: NAD-dependent epimerase/dehydratase family protein [Rhodothermales bacterium]|nr:NAD-dependent epimerase/dehydratase family protein [Rhodothermales bacterium]MBO6781611.1 NAD-dependent epimerase/dehydratase family protein [Rhodothermales bacterium]